MTDPRVVILLFAAVVMLGLLVIVLLLRSGPAGAGGSAVDLGGLKDWLEGKKTYLGMVALAFNNYAGRRGWIDAQLTTDLNTALALLTGVAFVAKANRIEQKTETAVVAAKIAAVVRPTDPPVKEGI
jgi:hypothetical protein